MDCYSIIEQMEGLDAYKNLSEISSKELVGLDAYNLTLLVRLIRKLNYNLPNFFSAPIKFII
jgi:hypothetical protein